MANASLEFDLCPHLSFELPVYYSAVNYFTYTWKFRTLAAQPELRYWFSRQNKGVFLGAHFGIGLYNFAFDGEQRYQDHDGHTPALGGGLTLGYRMPISKNRHWHLEFALGAGAYRLHYDTFVNVPNGQLTGSAKKTYIGPDRVAIAFSYSFSLAKKGGAR